MELDIAVSSCLICGVDHSPRNELSSEKCSNLISKHLHVIFLLRNVLEVPVEKLMIYLRSDPKVESWISVCDKCERMVNNCKVIYQDILTAQSQFRKVKQEIIKSLKKSSLVKPGEAEEDDEVISANIVEEIREYVYQNDYPETTDPFISGDRLSSQKLFETPVDKAVPDDDNHFWISPSDEEEGNEEELLLALRKVDDLEGTSTSAGAFTLEDRLSIANDDDQDDDCVYVDSDNDEEPLPLRQEENEKLMGTPEKASKLEDPLSQPMTIDLDGSSDDDDDQNEEDIGKDDDDDFNPDDESVDMDMDSDEDLDHDDDGNVSIITNEDDGDQGDESVPVNNTDQEKSEDDDDEEGTPIQNEQEPGKKSTHRRRHKLKGLLPAEPIAHSEDETFSCPLCPKKYPSWGQCNHHIKALHLSRTKYVCKRCGSTTDGPVKLRRHQEKCTGISYACPLAPACLRRFFKIHSLRIHLKGTHGKDEASLPPKVQKVMKKMRQLNSKSCEICGKTFKTSTLCQRHRHFVHEQKWKCSKCGVVKWTKGELETHEPICEQDKTWTCPVLECSLTYQTVTALNIHIGRLHKDQERIKVDTSDRPLIICEACGLTFKYRTRLNQHHKISGPCRRIRGLEPPPQKKKIPTICQICGKSYPSKAGLGVHVRVVHEKRFSKKCDICGKGFGGQSKLEQHLFMVHNIGEGVNRWRCEVEGCEAQIRSEKTREVHMRTKHGERERTWGCDLCGRKYLHERSLLQHRKEVHVLGKTYTKKKKMKTEEIINEGGGGGGDGDMINCVLNL